jgi:hypothetical protein
MAYLEESRYNHNVPRSGCREQEGPRWGAQRQVANAVCVETTLAVERHVFAQRARTYCRAANVLDTSYPDDDVRHTNFPALSMERRHVVVSVALQLKHWRRIPSPSLILASSV